MFEFVRDLEPAETQATLGCSWLVRCLPSVVDERVSFGPSEVDEGEAVAAVPVVSLVPPFSG